VERAPEVRDLLAYATELVEQVEPRRDPLVVTHGEPHPGNVIVTARGIVLIDWDTVGLAHPERDLWMFADEDGLLAHYTRITGRAVDPRAIALHDLGWTIADLAVNLHDLRSPHRVDEDTTHAWQVLQDMTWSDSRP
jgi:spectinomycin phosphotransferase